jgi:DNA-binding transcriptional LysR family regulator
VELRHLKYFLALADELHFGKAAEKLFIAQPPLSRQIMELEAGLGVKLFNRNKRNVELTPAGQYLMKEAKNVLYQVDNIKEQIKSIGAGLNGQLKIGYVGAAMHSVLPEILSRVNKNYPEIKTTLYELSNEEQKNAVLSGQIDVGFVRVPILHDRLISEKIFEETFSIVISMNHPLAVRKRIKLIDLAEEQFISFSSVCGRGMTDSIMSICHKAGFTPKISHETSQINTIIRLVESGIGYSIVPTSTKDSYKLNIKFIELKKFPERALMFLLYTKESCSFIKNLIKCI